MGKWGKLWNQRRFRPFNAERVFRRKGAVMSATLDDVTKKIKPEPTPEELAAKEMAGGPGTGPVPDRSGRSAEKVVFARLNQTAL